MDNLRSISTRAQITPVSFINEYSWGGLKADPRDFMRHFFESHAYDAACRQLVDLRDAYNQHSTLAVFQKEFQKYMAEHSRRRALVQRLVKTGLWRDK